MVPLADFVSPWRQTVKVLHLLDHSKVIIITDVLVTFKIGCRRGRNYGPITAEHIRGSYFRVQRQRIPDR